MKEKLNDQVSGKKKKKELEPWMAVGYRWQKIIIVFFHTTRKVNLKKKILRISNPHVYLAKLKVLG